MKQTTKKNWTFFSNHSHVFFLLALEKDLVLREVAQKVGITERAVQGIVADLEAEGFITREKVGRNNVYKPKLSKKLRHPIESHLSLEDLINLLKSK